MMLLLWFVMMGCIILREVFGLLFRVDVNYWWREVKYGCVVVGIC